MKKVVIFGATGNIGAYFTDHCVSVPKKEYEIIAVGRKNTDFFSKQGIPYFRVDIRKKEQFSILPDGDIYAVVNLAGILPAYLPEFDPLDYIDTNITGAVNILEYARQNNADRVLYSQTWAVQGGYWGDKTTLSPELPRKLLYSGDHAFYSITKSMIEDTLEFYREEYGIRSFVFRLPNVYMYHPDVEYYVNGEKRYVGYRRMIELAKAGEKLEMWGDPDAFKDILYIKDLCRMMYAALSADLNGGIYNAGTGIKTTMRQQIEGIVKVFSPKDAPSEIIPRPEKESFTSFVMDIENAVNELGYSPKYGYMDYLMDYGIEQEAKRFDGLWKS